MKPLIVVLALFCMTSGAPGLEQTKLDNRVRVLTEKFEALQSDPDKCIPAETLRRAKGIVLLDRTKAGFIFGFQGGGGVAMIKDPKTEHWGPIAFVNAAEASLGAQIGVQKSFIVVLFMTANASRWLAEPEFEFGGEARGTADTASGGVEGKMTSHEQVMLVYDDRKGLYGGAVIKGGSLAPESGANLAYYGEPMTMRDILFENAVKPTSAAIGLARFINESKAVRSADRSRSNRAPFVGTGKMAVAEPGSRMVRRSRTVGGVDEKTAAALNDPLLQLLNDLERNHQTNAIRHLHNYLSGMTVTLQTSDAATTIGLLEQLRAGRSQQAIEMLEARLDAAAIGLSSAVRDSENPERQTNSLHTLERIRNYRAQYPRSAAKNGR